MRISDWSSDVCSSDLYKAQNRHRSIGARLSGEIARRWGNLGMSDKPITIKMRGTAGQSLGVWNAGGLHLELEGDANDFVGKGMAGGRIVVKPARSEEHTSELQSLMRISYAVFCLKKKKDNNVT